MDEMKGRSVENGRWLPMVTRARTSPVTCGRGVGRETTEGTIMVEIREADSRDVETLARLMGQLGYPTTPEAMARRFREIAGDPSYATLVAELGGRVI